MPTIPRPLHAARVALTRAVRELGASASSVASVETWVVMTYRPPRLWRGLRRGASVPPIHTSSARNSAQDRAVDEDCRPKLGGDERRAGGPARGRELRHRVTDDDVETGTVLIDADVAHRFEDS